MSLPLLLPLGLSTAGLAAMFVGSVAAELPTPVPAQARALCDGCCDDGQAHFEAYAKAA